ncbi:MAG: ispE [Lacunisphaera sp.]|nr:ispE [Lacunisphaera sp.]
MNASVFSPAKINLFLAITGRRPDGFHDLVSVVTPLDFGDELVAEGRSQKKGGGGNRFSLTCNWPEVPVDGSNLVIKAAEAFAAATGWQGGVAFKLTKRIPVGAGLGGGSSNAVAALRALNRISGGLLSEAKMAEVAASLGSDCALFLKNGPVVMRGRGERVEPLPEAAAARLRGRRVLLFKPSFAISTPWAYARMAARGTDYVSGAEADGKLAAWQRSAAPAEELLGNNLEGAAFEKFIALPVLLAKLRADFGVNPRMSGSGSACFALLHDDFVTAPMIARIRDCWGLSVFVQEARLV